MSIEKVASRYAKSLLELADENKKLDVVMKDIQFFDKVVENKDFYLLMKSPVVPKDKKLKIFSSIFESRLDPLTLGFLRITIQKGREDLLPGMSDSFLAQYKALHKITTVTVTTVAPAEPAFLDTLKKNLEKASTTKDTIELITKTDPDLMGGFILEWDDKKYDASVRYKLSELKKDFKKNVYERQF